MEFFTQRLNKGGFMEEKLSTEQNKNFFQKNIKFVEISYIFVNDI